MTSLELDDIGVESPLDDAVDCALDDAVDCASFSDADSDSDSVTGTKPSENEDRIRFTPEMTRNVFRLRLLVFLVLTMAAIAVSLLVYFVTKGGETEEYESSYEGTASKVLEVFQGIATEKLDAVASLSIAATAHSSDVMSEWPLYSLSYFQERATAARKQSGTLFTSIVPLVTYEERDAWENYTVDDPEEWIQEGLDAQKQWDAMTLGVSLPSWVGDVHPGYISYDDWDAGTVRDDGFGPYFPIWQSSPLLKGLVNFNLASLPQWYDEVLACLTNQAVVIGKTLTPAPGNALHGSYLTRFFATILSIKYGKSVEYEGDPFSYVFFPVFDTFEDATKEAVAVMFTAISWRVYFENLLPDNIVGVTLVLENGCDEPFTYTINGQDVVFNGAGDLHDSSFDNMRRTTSFASVTNGTMLTSTNMERNNFEFDSTLCPYSISVYPSNAYYNMHNTATPIVITSAVAGIFIFTVLLFLAFDRLVEFRQRTLLRKATQTTEILSSIYPANIRDKLLAEHSMGGDSKRSEGSEFLAPNHRLKSFLNSSEKSTGDNSDLLGSQMGMAPLADLFPNTTVLFADIAGFTAWSSVRDPAQVFILLQTLYGAFDAIAKTRKVFKIETIGDCYVAVTGLPKPQENHAAIMARFASDCLTRMGQLTRQLQVTLGPGTDELGLRIGLHSGPVTAGVLRGDRARFQLFGDTDTGLRNKIQVSEKTADLLTASGKGHWIKPREDAVNAKGKGVLNTYWIDVRKRSNSVASRSSAGALSLEMDDASVSSGGSGEQTMSAPKDDKQSIKKEKHGRLVDWVVEIIIQYLHEILVMREARTKKGQPEKKDFQFSKQGTNLDEVVEIRSLVQKISETYRDNPFHNFEHACHVTMSVHKLLSRIVAPDLEVEEIEQAEMNAKEFASHLHDYTHGIHSDPWTRCAIIFSALIHDSDHRGVSNTQLGKEDEAMATLYQNKSLAEQNSLDLSWVIFMDPDYSDFRNCLFGDEAEFARFRQVCVNTVLATDIFDKELNDLRKKRWEKAFSMEKVEGKDAPKPTGDSGLRATIVIEHIIQASDVSHTMQHWHVYRKWNKSLFKEMHKAYKEGRMGADPIKFWYKGEIGFFDNYIIPLAKKLKDCGVFGVSSDECLNYALQNRNEWEARGEEIVQELIAEIRDEEEADTQEDTA